MTHSRNSLFCCAFFVVIFGVFWGFFLLFFAIPWPIVPGIHKTLKCNPWEVRFIIMPLKYKGSQASFLMAKMYFSRHCSIFKLFFSHSGPTNVTALCTQWFTRAPICRIGAQGEGDLSACAVSACLSCSWWITLRSVWHLRHHPPLWQLRTF